MSQESEPTTFNVRVFAGSPSMEPLRPISGSTVTLDESIHATTDAVQEPTPPSQPTTTGGSATAGSDVVVLTPSRLRIDSRVIFSQATIQWPSNCLFGLLLWLKLDNRIAWSWWLVFAPTWVSHILLVPLQVAVILCVNHLIYKQLGPAPPITATAGLHLQYQVLKKTRTKSHLVDGIIALLESTAMLIVKLLLCWCLEAKAWIPFRILFCPFWVAWIASLLLTFVKERNERMIISMRDLQYIFFLFVAFKLDGECGYAWRFIFLMPWLFFSMLFLLACVMVFLLLHARVWSRLLELLLPVGFLLLLMSTVPQFMSYIALVQRLDSYGPEAFTVDESWQSIFLPNMLSWALMWASMCVLATGLRQKEKTREQLLASGRVWTAHEDVARRFHDDREAAQRKVDQLTEEEIARMVEEMMAGRTKPSQLMRVGTTLYKRMTSFDGLGKMYAGLDIDVGETIKAVVVDDAPSLAGATGVELTSLARASSSKVVPVPDDGAAPADSVMGNLVTLGQLTSPPAASGTASTPGGDVVIEVGPSTATDSRAGQHVADQEQPAVQVGRHDSAGDDLCLICYDNPASCVLLECGHGGFCRKCAFLMFVRPPNECPTCRQRIEQVLEIEPGYVGQPAKVK